MNESIGKKFQTAMILMAFMERLNQAREIFGDEIVERCVREATNEYIVQEGDDPEKARIATELRKFILDQFKKGRD